MKAILRILSDMNCKFELNSDTPGVTFDDGSFHLYNELPKPSEMLDRVEVLRTGGLLESDGITLLRTAHSAVAMI